MIHIDIESRSPVNLVKRGTYIYARDPGTELLCLCYAFDDGPVQGWVPGEPAPAELIERIERGEECWAHNAQFERLMFDFVIEPDHEIPAPALEQWRCTATLARLRALPGKLGDAARALRLKYRKDRRGEALIKRMCIPPYEYNPALLGEMLAYCARDVEVEREIHRVVPAVDEADWVGYQESERINDRGLKVDRAVAAAAVPFAEREREALVAELEHLTGIPTLGSPKVLEWVRARLSGEALAVLRADNKGGWSLDGYRQRVLLDREDLPDDVRKVVALKLAGGKASVAKYQAMLDRADPDDARVRGAYLYAGAGQTGRFSSVGLQVHNLPRQCAPDPEETARQLQRGAGDLETLASMLRPSIVAEGTFVCADWAGIEARALPWLTDEAEAVLDVFREGRDIYVETAKQIPGADRQIGKVAVLSLGYGGAVGAFQAMARNYGVRLEEGLVRRVVDAWREANGWATRFWGNLEQAVAAAWDLEGAWHPVGRVAYQRRGDHLFCRLPSGRELMYPWFMAEIEETRWGPRRAYSCIKSRLVPAEGNPWPRMRLWGGLLAENVTQAVCADLLVDALVACSHLPVVGHTHDEILLEVSDDAGRYVAELEEIMLSASGWARGLPLAVETWTGPRFKK